MDVMDRVANVLLGNRRNTYCTACLATNLAVASEHEVQQVITALSDSASFQRSVSRCSLCGRGGFVISSNISVVSTGHGGAVSNGSEALELIEAEADVRELEQHVADQQIRIKHLQVAGRNDDEMKAREGLFLLGDALEIARRRLQAEREARGIR